jgi:23S rRNA (cytosine1962-C5)-methyltransferase
MMPKATLCILTRNYPTSQVLLGYKKTGFGKGKYTGFGGKVEPGESVIAAARRELAEETGIHVPIENLLPIGVLTFVFPKQPGWDQEVHVFRLDSWHGEPLESEEMKPDWFNIDEIPYDRMWDDGRYWLPAILAGKTYTARFTFRDDNATVEKVEISQSEPNSPMTFTLPPLLASTLLARSELLAADSQHESAIRLFNGFLEGCPELVAESFADTLVLHNHADPSKIGFPFVAEGQAFYLDHLPWIKTVVVKNHGGDPRQVSAKRGAITFGDTPAHKIREHGVWYAINLLLHQDTTFYPDTRNLRRWVLDHAVGKRVLNTFAYTGSLGVAARAGGAQCVIQLDRNKTYLDLAKSSYKLNGFSSRRGEFLIGDFFSQINALKKEGKLFDCLILDPPFFSVTNKGRVDLVSQSARLINKVRPLVANDGWLVTVNNSLFLSGKDYLHLLGGLCADGYLVIEELVPVPPDCAGFPETQLRTLPADPAPFNHATKIAVLRVRRKERKP